MNLYLSSYGIPAPRELEKLLNITLQAAKVALIPNAKDYLAQDDRDTKIKAYIAKYLQPLGLNVDVIDLRGYNDLVALEKTLRNYNLVWVMPGNTYVLRYEMQRSGFENIIRELLASGVVYGGGSAGALVAGMSIDGVEAIDNPVFAQALINEGLNLAPYIIVPHADNAELSGLLPSMQAKHLDKQCIELNDSQSAVITNDRYVIVDAEKSSRK